MKFTKAIEGVTPTQNWSHLYCRVYSNNNEAPIYDCEIKEVHDNYIVLDSNPIRILHKNNIKEPYYYDKNRELILRSLDNQIYKIGFKYGY